MSKTISNLQDIEIKDLLFMKNQKTRIQEREEKIKYLESLFKYTPKTISNNIKSESNIKTNSKKKSNKNKNLHLKLPKINIIDNNTMNSYERMKNYKVFFHKKRNNTLDSKVKNILIKSGFSYNLHNNNEFIITNQNDNQKKKKSIAKKSKKIDELKNDIIQKFVEESPKTQKPKREPDKIEINEQTKYKKIKFDDYLKMQAKAESMLKPKLGENSTDLIEYIKAIQGIRLNIIENIIKDINNAENRFNKEKPSDDSNFNVMDKTIYIHKWKNLFFLRDYQRFFLKGLKGKISNNNFYQMQKKFLEINSICFAESKGQQIKNIELPK